MTAIMTSAMIAAFSRYLSFDGSYGGTQRARIAATTGAPNQHKNHRESQMRARSVQRKYQQRNFLDLVAYPQNYLRHE